jgi:hypothetical protein
MPKPTDKDEIPTVSGSDHASRGKSDSPLPGIEGYRILEELGEGGARGHQTGGGF